MGFTINIKTDRKNVLHCMRSMALKVANIKVTVFRDVMSHTATYSSTLRMEAESSFEILLPIYQTTIRYIPENHDLACYTTSC